MKNTFLITTILCLIASCSSNSNTETTEETNTADSITEEITVKTGYAIGDIATDFSLKNVDNKMVSLADYPDAKGFIVIFTCNQCPFSILYEDRIIALDKKYKTLGFPVIAINPNDPTAEGGEEDDFESMKTKAKEKAFTFPYLYDDGQTTYPQYGATKTPHTYVLHKTENGNTVKYIGAIDDDKEGEEITEKYVELAIDALLAGKEVEQTYIPAIGCSIKTKK